MRIFQFGVMLILMSMYRLITMITTVPLLVNKCVNFNGFLFHIYITEGFDMEF